MSRVFDSIHCGSEIALALAAAPTFWSPVDLSDAELDQLEASADALIASALEGSGVVRLTPTHQDACRLAMLLGKQLESFAKTGFRPFTPASALSRRVHRYLVSLHAGAPELLDPAVIWPCLDISEPGGTARGGPIVFHLAVHDIGLPGMRAALGGGITQALEALAPRTAPRTPNTQNTTIAEECVSCGRWNFLLWVCGDLQLQPQPEFEALLPLLLSDPTPAWLVSAVVAKGATLRPHAATVPEAILLLGLAKVAERARSGQISLADPARVALKNWEDRYVNEAAVMANVVHRSYKAPRASGTPQFNDIGMLLDTWCAFTGADRRRLAVSFMQRLSDLTPSILGQSWAEPIVLKTAAYLTEVGFSANDQAPGLNVGRETMEHIVLRLLGPAAAAVLRAHSHSDTMHAAVGQALDAGQTCGKAVVAIPEGSSKLGDGGGLPPADSGLVAAARPRRMRI